ncbi:MAG TPA: hypothetical protein VI279_09075 [Rhodocyclaceae bacterium]
MAESAPQPRWPWPGIGLAAGYDRDGSRIDEIAGAGFDFVEFGTVTPHPEPNHNPGVAPLASRLRAARGQGRFDRCGVGISVGCSFQSQGDGVADDWRCAAEQAWPLLDFLVINLSAPYYRHLLQAAEPLGRQLERLGTALPGDKPVLLKLPVGVPGLALPPWLHLLPEWGIRGMVVSQAAEGVAQAASLLRQLRHLLPGQVLLSVGGIASPQTLAQRLAAGADAVEVFTAYQSGGSDALAALLALADLQPT